MHIGIYQGNVLFLTDNRISAFLDVSGMSRYHKTLLM